MDLAARLVDELTSAGRTVAVAESLTGGLVISAIVEVPGASQCLRGGVVAYATDLKASLLGVSGELLGRHGPVHPEVALAMARGVRERLSADYGVATTGVAGPAALPGTPPGTFHVAVAGHHGARVVSVDLGAGTDRSAIRASACRRALELAWEVIDEDLGTPDGVDALDPA